MSPEEIDRAIFQTWFEDIGHRARTMQDFAAAWRARFPGDAGFDAVFAAYGF